MCMGKVARLDGISYEVMKGKIKIIEVSKNVQWFGCVERRESGEFYI